MIEINGLGVRADEVVALSQVDLTVGEGEFVHVAGPNGAGKSTLLRVLVGLLRPTEGTVLVGGARPGSPDAKTHAGYVPDVPLLYDTLTVAEHLDFLAKVWGAQAPADGLHRFGLTGLGDRYAGRLSLGQRQRLSLALATFHAPRLLVLDEPFNGLDADTHAFLLGVLHAQVAGGGTVVLASHTLPEEAAVSRLVLLRQGHLVADRPVRPGEDALGLAQQLLAGGSTQPLGSGATS